MSYVFEGVVVTVHREACRVRMSDRTGQTRPDEMWLVHRSFLPEDPVVGQLVTFTVTDSGGTFGQRLVGGPIGVEWLAAHDEATRVTARAEKLRRLFREPTKETV